MSKSKEKWLQVGNFLLGVDTNAHGLYVVCKSVAQNWSVRWREDTLMFAMMLNVMKRAAEDDNVKEYLHSLVSLFFVCTTYTHDLVALATKTEMPFCEGVARLMKEQTDYENSLSEKPTAEEDEKALDEVADMQALEDELALLDEKE